MYTSVIALKQDVNEATDYLNSTNMTEYKDLEIDLIPEDMQVI